METISSADSIIKFLFLSSALLLILGVLSSFLLRILKIQGKPKLWICILLVIMPLAYPIQALFPDLIKISIPLETFQSFDFQPFDTTTGENPVSEGVSFLTSEGISADQTGGKETTFIERETSRTHSTNRPDEALSEFTIDWKLMVTLVWGLVFLYFLVRLVTMVYHTNRLLRLADPVTDPQALKLLHRCAVDTGLRRTPSLLTVDRIPASMVMGFLNPGILVPKHLLKPEFREGLQFALLHELKHVHRHHNWWLLVESLIGAAYFFHPIIHWAKKRIHEELEHICDNHVIHITNKSISYADFLLHEIWQQKCERNLVLALPFVSGGVKTTSRVKSILENARPTLFAQIRGRIAVGLILLSFMSLLLCSVAPSAKGTVQTFHRMNPATTDSNKDSASFQTGTAEMEEIVLLKENPSTRLSKEQPSFNDTTDSFQVAAADVRLEAYEENAGEAALQEEPIYQPILGSENPAVIMADARIQTTKDPEKQTESDSVQSVTEPVLGNDAEDSVFLAQNESPVEASSDAATVSDTKTIELKTEDAATYYNRGNAHYKQGRIDKAISDYSKAIELNPRFAAAYRNRGSAYYKQGRFDYAISDYNKAIELNPENAVVYYNRGTAYSKTAKAISDYNKAISDYNKAVEIAPGFSAAYSKRGSAYCVKGRLRKAISDFSKVIELNPEDAAAYSKRGSAYYVKGRLRKAISDFSKAIELNPEDAAAYNKRGTAYYVKKRFHKAISDYNKAIELNPEYTDAYINRGYLYHFIREYEKAVSDYGKAIELNPEDNIIKKRQEYAFAHKQWPPYPIYHIIVYREPEPLPLPDWENKNWDWPSFQPSQPPQPPQSLLGPLLGK